MLEFLWIYYFHKFEEFYGPFFFLLRSVIIIIDSFPTEQKKYDKLIFHCKQQLCLISHVYHSYGSLSIKYWFKIHFRQFKNIFVGGANRHKTPYYSCKRAIKKIILPIKHPCLVLNKASAVYYYHQTVCLIHSAC